MKLIRLVTEDKNGFFDEQFNTEVILEPNSKIALQSASFQSALKTIDVNDSNRRMTFLLKNLTDASTENLGIVLDEKFYNDTNHNTLFLDIEKKFNESMDFNRNTLGIDFNLSKDSNNKIEIGYRRSGLTDFETLDNLGHVSENLNLSIAGQSLRNTQNVANADDSSRIISGLPMGNGIKAFRGQPSQDQANTDGCKIGLTQNNNTIGGIIDAEFFIKNNGDGQPYSFLSQKGLAVQNTTFNATCTGANKDIIEIAIVGDQVIGTVYRHGQANADTLFTTPYSQNDFLNLFPYVSIQAKQNDMSIENVTFTPDMYFFDNDDFIEPMLSLNSLYNNIFRNHSLNIVQLNAMKSGFTASPVTPRPLDEFLEGTLTMARIMANYLGIKNKITVIREQKFIDISTGTELNILVVNGSFVFKGDVFTNNFLVELNSIDIESYDSVEGRRKNIIASIPKQDQIGVIQYEPNNLYFVNTRNVQSLSLRNINARILNIDGSTPTLQGISVLNLLIDDN